MYISILPHSRSLLWFLS